jgi:hypothetical protein
MRTLEPEAIRRLWQRVLQEQQGGNPIEACTEGFTWVTRDQGAPTDFEARIGLSCQVVDARTKLYFVPANDGDERPITLLDEEAVKLIEIVVMLADYGVISASHNGGTRSDFVMRVDSAGKIYLLPPKVAATATDPQLADDEYFLAERVLDFIEVC